MASIIGVNANNTENMTAHVVVLDEEDDESGETHGHSLCGRLFGIVYGAFQDITDITTVSDKQYTFHQCGTCKRINGNSLY